MITEFDEAKNAWNIRERGLSFSRAADFDFGTAVVKLVQRNGELRWVATGYLDGVLHLLCFLGGPEVNPGDQLSYCESEGAGGL